MKSPSPLLGFNNNVRHKGRIFHIQTEDSGIRHPHIITHLFADGGRILKTTKTSYAEHVGTPAMAETVRALMQEQHKAMFIALRDGQFDHLIEPPATGAHPVLRDRPSAPTAAPPPPSQPEAVAPQPPATTPVPPAAVVDRAHPAAAAVSAAAQAGSPAAAPPPPAARSIDLDALERAAEEAQTPFFQQIQDLPPPPAAVLAKKPPGSSRAGGTRVNTPMPSPPPVQASAPPDSAGATSRYAQSRPASIFATTRPAEGASIFGEDLISEKSLDEVILSYLAEDLDSGPEKK